jgi:hypothetical protein
MEHTYFFYKGHIHNLMDYMYYFIYENKPI